MYISSKVPRLAGSLLDVLVSKAACSHAPDLEIELFSHEEDKVYTTGSTISGTARIIAREQSIHFNTVQITFEGQTKVAMEQMSQMSGQNTIQATHTFLKLNMPIAPSSLTTSRILEPAMPISIPFNFIVPSELLPQSCTHPVESDSVHSSHCQLPPSMDTSGLASTIPETSTIRYYVSVKLVQGDPVTGKLAVLKHSTFPIIIVPSASESPPLDIPLDSGEYQLSRSKMLRKGVFSGKLGEICIFAAQPKPLNITFTKCQTMVQQTYLAVTLTFDSFTKAPPPEIDSITTRLKSYTFLSLKGQPILARKCDQSLAYDPSKTYFSSTTNLSTITPSTNWIFQRNAPVYTRRDSGYETSGTNSTQASATTGLYTTTIQIPLSLPDVKGRVWLPTFHSCTISRFYVLTLKCKIKSATLALRIPVQVMYRGDIINIRVMEEDIGRDLGVDEVLRPRLLSVPNIEFIRNSIGEEISATGMLMNELQELPPDYAGGYEDYVRRQSLITR